MTSLKKISGNSHVTSRLVDLITEMPLGEQQAFLKELEKKISKFKREHHRKPIRAAVEYATQESVYRSFVQNISVGGAFIETRIPIRVGQDISLNFVLPTNPQKHIKINGQIVRVSPQGVGVEFKALNKEQKMLIKSYLDMV